MILFTKKKKEITTEERNIPVGDIFNDIYNYLGGDLYKNFGEE